MNICFLQYLFTHAKKIGTALNHSPSHSQLLVSSTRSELSMIGASCRILKLLKFLALSNFAKGTYQLVFHLLFYIFLYSIRWTLTICMNVRNYYMNAYERVPARRLYLCL